MPRIGKGGTIKNRAMMIHALVHVELAAIDISWDICIRSWKERHDLPLEFYLDWLEVAAEEAKHYKCLRIRL